jgi:hypothetical protein
MGLWTGDWADFPRRDRTCDVLRSLSLGSCGRGRRGDKLDRLGRLTRETARALIDRNSKASASVQGSVRNVVAGPLAEDYKREETTMRKITRLGCEHLCFR